MGHLTLGAPLVLSFQSSLAKFSQSNIRRRISDRQDRCWKVGVKAPLVVENAPGDASELVG
jgi:hypothetical protein